ncbi:antibiotic biosynthesis monooxygenase [Candidatus Vecturithrix granuli]|uniref:Antibiotic biosynthesis monooxygenase n=1 Tax=Vecturithrix granuli TaxID=1499967 RepID=A0A081C7R6_VECG1|nr:antibiotic biosynthesis monooxygenase [Candidatus Vecturithrix granuli]
MIAVTITMTVLPQKRQELLLTLHELIAVMRQDTGFLDARISMKNGNSSVVTLIAEWETPEAVQTYMQSEYFRILCGALQLLTSSSEVMLQQKDNLSKGKPV